MTEYTRGYADASRATDPAVLRNLYLTTQDVVNGCPRMDVDPYWRGVFDCYVGRPAQV